MKKLFFLLISTLFFSQNVNFTWIQGNNQTQQDAEFGIYGVDSDDNWPNVLGDMAYVVDNDKTLWMFGGITTGYIEKGSSLLWSYDILNNKFKFRKGWLYHDFEGFNKGLNIESYRNIPPSVSLSSLWISSNKILYKFGGTNAGNNLSNDLWKFNISTNNWIKIASGTKDATGHFGIKGVEDVANIPPGLINTTTWTDEIGNLYLFGGRTGTPGTYGSVDYDSVWKYNISTNMWSWISGSDQPNINANYNSLGQENSLNSPGARYGSCAFKDSQGNIYIYGGFHQYQSFNDLWIYKLNTKQWTWLKGDATSHENIVSDIGIENSNNLPGILSWSLNNPKPNNWIDKNGDFWIMVNNLMWRYRLSTNSWTVMKENVTTSYPQLPVYGTKNVENSENFPGILNSSACWTGSDGDFYQFNGSMSSNHSSTLWKYNTKTNNWVWIKGNVVDYLNTVTTYQKLAGLLENENTPGGTATFGAKWTDEEGNLWIYGIYGTFDNENNTSGYSSVDLWRFNISEKKWQWINGKENSFYKIYGDLADYGTINVENKNNSPGRRLRAMSWIDKNGNFWMFGGTSENNRYFFYQDMWMYNRITDNWVWKGGIQNSKNGYGNYGASGVYAITNIPGARMNGKTWTDKDGNFYLYGGYGFDENSTSQGYLNDLWKYDVSINQWVWLSGDKTINNFNGINYPIADYGKGIGWNDENKNFWYFSSGNMWKYQINNNSWIKITSSLPYASANYGIIGIENASNYPGSNREGALTWAGKNGDFWLLGGGDSLSQQDYWRYNINTNNWTWMFGPKTFSPYNYGQLNVPSSTNLPPYRHNSATWNDNLGNFYFFGGGVNTSDRNYYNDVWRIDYNNISPNLFTITAQDETCDIKNNGAIIISSTENNTYSYSLNGGTWTSFTSPFTINNLNSGYFDLCIKSSNGTKYCYGLNIGKPENLTGKILRTGNLSNVQIFSGTAPFTISYGKKTMIVASVGSYNLTLDTLLDKITVESSKPCEGIISKEIFNGKEEGGVFPNPTTDNLNILWPLNEKIQVAIFTLNGNLVMQQDINEIEPKSFSVKNLSPGSYIIVIKSEKQTITKKFLKQ